MDPMRRKIRRMALPLTAVLVLLLTGAPVLHPGVASAAEGFPDISEEPAKIQEAINYVAAKGYMNGDSSGNFNPGEPTTRIDYCKALVKMFGHSEEETDPSISFIDISSNDPEFKYANLAAKHDYLEPFGDNSFRPCEPINTVNALTGLSRGLEMDLQAQHVRGLYPRGPEYEGELVVAHDLHLKYRNSRSWPSDDYPRGETAYSLFTADNLEEWREEYIKESFDWLKCQSPWLGPLRQQALDSAFSKIGYPYVWGGESDPEGGYDCSGLTYYVLKTCLGLPMMRVADDQARDSRYATVGRKELLAGDPIFFFSDPTGDPNDYVGHAGMYIGKDLFIHSTGSNAGVSVDCLSGYWETHFAWGKRVIGEPEPQTFDTYILLMNPCDETAEGGLTYMLPDGEHYRREIEVPPLSRRTVKVDDTLVNQEVSTTVSLDSGEVVAERSMYFDYRGEFPGGHDSTGVQRASRQWFMAEGCTGYGFDTYILVQNPSDETAQVMATYMTPEGETVEQAFSVGPHSRHTVEVDSVPGMESASFSTTISSDTDVVVERSMYFDYFGIKGGHNSPATAELSHDWYFAEGYTGKGFDSYILIQNPSDRITEVTLKLIDPEGVEADIKFGMAPYSRRTVEVDRINGWYSREFSASLHSEQVPVAAERSMYFEYEGLLGGHNTFGATVSHNEWYLAEGYTAQEFDTYVLLLNLAESDTEVCVRFMLNGGTHTDRKYEVPARSRFTIPVDKVEGLQAQEVSTYVCSGAPIVVERAVYFRYQGAEGGTCAAGVTGPAGIWHFAEGYTGM